MLPFSDLSGRRSAVGSVRQVARETGVILARTTFSRDNDGRIGIKAFRRRG